jgi:spermidine/putrescine transport system permease protein
MRSSQALVPRKLLIGLVLFAGLFLYIPIIVLIAYSFNENAFTYEWHGFTIQWYVRLFASYEVWHALENSLIVACAAVVLSLSMGAMLMFWGSTLIVQRSLALFYGSLAIPEIIIAVGLLSLFFMFRIPLGFATLIVGHTLIGLGYVVPMLHARHAEIDPSYLEASYDLGASRVQTLFYVVLPLLLPALISGGLLVFIVSFDDFVFSFFCSQASAGTLPVYVYSLIQSGATPVVNALSVLMLLVSGIVVFGISLFQAQTTRGG